jgi:formate/nitrite transporter FocA (FNT family)
MANQKKSKKEVDEIEDRSRLRVPLIYEIVRHEGDEEMDRPTSSLWWSGIAAGLSISFSLLTQAVIIAALPDERWRELISPLGYSVGFLIVILGRQQLFTENTVTVVLPLMADFNRRNFMRTSRVWGIVFAANMVGVLVAAGFCTFTPVIAPEIRAAMLEVSQRAIDFGWWELLLRGITAGFLIAALTWLIPSAKGTEFFVILLIAYLIALFRSAHVVAGGMDVFMLGFAGKLSPGSILGSFIVPALIGNVIGGTGLFALLAYGQVVEEL